MPPCAGHCCGHCCGLLWPPLWPLVLLPLLLLLPYQLLLVCCPLLESFLLLPLSFLLFLLPPHHPFEPACAHSSQSLDILLILVFWQPLFLLQELQPLPHMGTAWSQAFAMFIPPPPPFPSIFPFFFFPPPWGLPCGSPFFFFLVIPPALPLFPSILPPFFPPIITPAVFGHWGLAFAPASAGWLRWWRPGVVRAGRGWYHTLPLHKAWPFCRTECPFQGKSKWSALSRGLALGLVANQGSLTALAAWAQNWNRICNIVQVALGFAYTTCCFWLGSTWPCIATPFFTHVCRRVVLLYVQYLHLAQPLYKATAFVQGFGVCLHSPFARLLPLFKATALCKAIHIMPFHIFERVSTWQLILSPWWHQPACKQARAPPPAAYGKPWAWQLGPKTHWPQASW